MLDLPILEQMMIRWHMGTFDKSFLMYQKSILDKYPECLIMFMADWMASVFIDDKKGESK